MCYGIFLFSEIIKREIFSKNDQLWKPNEPLLPKKPLRPKGGRQPIEDRKALTGIIFVIRTGIPRQYRIKTINAKSQCLTNNKMAVILWLVQWTFTSLEKNNILCCF